MIFFLKNKTIGGLDVTRITNITQNIRTYDPSEMVAAAFGLATNYSLFNLPLDFQMNASHTRP